MRGLVPGIRYFILLIGLVLATSVSAREFKIFDLITATGKPDSLALDRMHMIYQWHAYGGPHTDEKEKNYEGSIPEKYMKCCYVKDNLDDNPPEYYSIDLEQWKLYRLPEQEVRRNLQFYKRAFKLFRETLPENAKISWYNIGALPNHRILKSRISPENFNKWRRQNDRLKMIVSDYDFMQPSLYMSTKFSLDMWKNKAEAFIAEHKRLAPGKPVFAHISPQYVNEPGRLISGGAWGEMLAFLYDRTDGVIIWTFPQVKYRIEWNEKAEWWVQTLKFSHLVRDNSVNYSIESVQ